MSGLRESVNGGEDKETEKNERKVDKIHVEKLESSRENSR